jgi:hypothetical protein
MSDYRKIYEQYYGVKIPKGYHIHHKDMNHSNDDPLNLEALPKDEHAQKHGFLNNFIMAHSTALERAAVSPKRKEISVKMKGNTRGLGYKRPEEGRKEISRRMLGNRYAVGNHNTLGYKFTKEQSAARSLLQRGRKHTEEYKKKQSIRIREWWASRKAKKLIFLIALIMLLGVTPAHAHITAKVLSCPAFKSIEHLTIPQHPTPFRTKIAENGMVAEFYDVTGDGKVDIVTYSSPSGVFAQDGDPVHKREPVFYEIDEDGDQTADVLFIDIHGEQRCEDLIQYSEEDANHGGLT